MAERIATADESRGTTKLPWTTDPGRNTTPDTERQTSSQRQEPADTATVWLPAEIQPHHDNNMRPH